ncbi:MAG: hypothetical protein ACRC9L_02120 [Brevinema sp.]
MIAYINKHNIVVYIAPTKADEIQANSKGKLLFTEGEYDSKTMKYAHVFGKGEEVRAVNSDSLAIGDEYMPPSTNIVEENPKDRSLKEAITAKKAELAEIRQQILKAQADEDEALIAKLRPKRDTLKAELDTLNNELQK